MPNQRIYYVPPRLMGKLDQWSWLPAYVADLGFNAIWFSPVWQVTEVTKQDHGRTVTGSTYALRNYFRVNDELSTGDHRNDLALIKDFCADAAAKGVRVYADIVFNHVAADHPLVLQENRKIEAIKRSFPLAAPVYGADGDVCGITYIEKGRYKTLGLKFKRERDFSLRICGPADDPWNDVAQINYHSPEARRFFVDSKNAYWKKVLDRMVDLGFTGFRCDVAYMVPPDVWQKLITHTRRRQPDALFMAETLGGPQDKIEALAHARLRLDDETTRPAFDFGMLGIYWWDFINPGIPFHDLPQSLRMSRLGGIGSPDTHDTEKTLGQTLRHFFNNRTDRATDKAIADASVRDYAVCALTCSSAFMQMGFEFCNEKKNSVFRGDISHTDWQSLQARRGGPLDIRDRIRAINNIKSALGVENAYVTFRSCEILQDGKIVRLHCDYTDIDRGNKKAEIILLINRQPENGPVRLDHHVTESMKNDRFERTGSAEYLHDFILYHTPVTATPVKSALKSGMSDPSWKK